MSDSFSTLVHIDGCDILLRASYLNHRDDVPPRMTTLP